MGNRLLVVVSRYSMDRFDPGDFVTELSELISKKGFKVSVLAPHNYNLKFFPRQFDHYLYIQP